MVWLYLPPAAMTHGRLQAAKHLSLKKVPVIILDHLTDEEKRAYVIADNQLALDAGWDDGLLKTELGALADMDFDLSVLGFSETELAGILEGLDDGAGNTEDEAVPEVPVTPKTKLGDVYNRGIGFDKYLFVFQAAPQTFYKNIVEKPPFAIHANLYFLRRKCFDECGCRKLNTLIGVEDFWLAILFHRFLQRLDAKTCFHCDRQSPR